MQTVVRVVFFVLVALIGVSHVSAQILTQLGADIDGEAVDDYSGSSVSLSADGTRIAVGAPGAGGGQMRIFEYSEGSWVQLGTDIDGDVEEDRSGYSVSLSADGTRVAVGARGNSSHTGHVRVFEHYFDSWLECKSNCPKLENEEPHAIMTFSPSIKTKQRSIGMRREEKNGQFDLHSSI